MGTASRLSVQQELSTFDLPRYLQPEVPSVFTLEITQRCQHRCLGCGNVFRHSGYEMAVDEWATILDRLRAYIQALRITGGEPTLHRQFARLMTLIDELGVPFVLFTNGNWADADSTLGVLTHCINLQGILVSLHGAEPATYRQFTGTHDFANVTTNIRRAAEADVRVATNTLLLTTTWQHIDSIADLSLSLGASAVCFGRYYGQPLPSLSLSDDQLKVALQRIVEIRQREPRVVLSNCVPACFLPGVDFGERGCTSGFTHCTIGPRGDVRPCTHTPLTLGYLPRDEIQALWSSPILKAWREQIPMACRMCTALNRCKGGCRATAQQLGLAQDPLMGDPLVASVSMPLVELATSDRPRLTCSVEPAPHGYTLIGPGRFVTLSPHSHPILNMLDGQTTIEQLQDRFGMVAVQLVASLLHKHMVEV